MKKRYTYISPKTCQPIIILIIKYIFKKSRAFNICERPFGYLKNRHVTVMWSFKLQMADFPFQIFQQKLLLREALAICLIWLNNLSNLFFILKNHCILHLMIKNNDYTLLVKTKISVREKFSYLRNDTVGGIRFWKYWKIAINNF